MSFLILEGANRTEKKYDMTAKEEAELAAKQFNELLAVGKQMVGVDRYGNKFMAGYFDPTAVEYVVTNRAVGG